MAESTVNWQRDTSIVVEKATPGAFRLTGYRDFQGSIEVEPHAGRRDLEHLAGGLPADLELVLFRLQPLLSLSSIARARRAIG